MKDYDGGAQSLSYFLLKLDFVSDGINVQEGFVFVHYKPMIVKKIFSK